ncbi:Crp/Fnr family transcriptional regulator [Phenylobacterium sp.]|jgi:CRP-like cAMP-binding protein|uniref:Crp/Fnr family transcriptional regulator n=1 Tax=Phenylobacterium sp. TaxID=1871053 RepID=UPI002F95AD60
MSHILVRKLRHGAELSPLDEAALVGAIHDGKRLAARQTVVSEGDRPRDVHVILDGFACRYKILPDGGRQIMAWLVPGDFCDLHVAILGAMDHGIATLTPSRLGTIPPADVDRLSRTSPALSRALWWATLVDEAILREWLVTMGRRPADRQVAHLFCELLVRLQSVGLADGNRIELPITQGDLADAAGLTAVHVNRVVQQLRADGLIDWSDRTLTVHDPRALAEFADFRPNYLHLKGELWSGTADAALAGK